MSEATDATPRPDHSGDEQWYWDLQRGVAVPASQRSLASQMLGPYGSRAEAERWQQTVEQRNEAWDDADDDWNDTWADDDPADDGG